MKANKKLFEFNNKKDYEVFLEHLFLLAEEKYKKFNQKLIPNYKNIIGIRTPILKDIAKKIVKSNPKNYFQVFDSFIKNKKEIYHEEKLIYCYLVAFTKENFQRKIKRIDSFIDLIDNWAICDSISSFKFVNDNKEEYFSYILEKIENKDIWEQRFILVFLLNFYIEKEYLNKIFDISEEIKSKEYYVSMAKAWLLSICYIKFKKESFEFLRNSNLDNWTINKTVQKIRESTRVSKIEKEEVLKLKR